VVTNIEEDHLDYYQDIDDIQRAFGQFLRLLPPDGCAVGNGDDSRVAQLFEGLACRTFTFGLSPSCDWQPLGLTYDAQGYGSFEAAFHGKPLGRVSLKVAGFFHVYNALATVACAYALNADPVVVCAALSEFTGAHRRFEFTGEIDGVKLYHDYGHNPTEMRNVLSVAKLQPHNRLWAVMQPHTFSRVKRLFADYLTCTRDADITLVTDICAAREKDPGDIHAGQIVEGMLAKGVRAVHTPTFDDTERYLRAHWQPGDLVLTLGCGNINQLNEQMCRHETERVAQKP
jgi:UDP-N-acetylmuramate--alanine ligase